ncbi:MAG: hypothetical protein J7639_33190 [Paenibacillaceae bacterium]|nr:hypothetical protein [Paenibacillaceae bacterium]
MSELGCKDAIKSIIHNHGTKVLDNPRMFQAMLMDYFPQSRRARNLMLCGLQINIFLDLSIIIGDVVPKTVVERLRLKLYEECGIDAGLAHWVVQEWAGVLDKRVDVPPPVPATALLPPPAPPIVRYIDMPAPVVKPRRYFAVISTTAILTALLCIWIGSWSGHASPDEAEGVGAASQSKVTDTSPVTNDSLVEPKINSVSFKKDAPESVEIRKNSRVVLKVRDAFTDELTIIYFYAADEVASVEARDWKYGKKGDPIYEGKYYFYLERNDGSLLRTVNFNLRLNMNRIMVFSSKSNDSVFIFTVYELSGLVKPTYVMFQLVGGQLSYIGLKSEEVFSENMLPKDLLK